MNNSIFTLAEALETGKKFAFVKGNRVIDEKNVKSKLASMIKLGGNIVPIMVVSGKKAYNDGCKFVDPRTNNDIVINSEEEADLYIIIYDGQHRYFAATSKESDISPEKVTFMYSSTDVRTSQLISDSNIQTCKWPKIEYVRGAALTATTCEFAKFCADLAQDGYSYSVIGQIVTQSNVRLPIGIFTELMNNPNFNVCSYRTSKNSPLFQYNLDRASNYVLGLEELGIYETFGKHRYLIQAVIWLAGNSKNTLDEIIEAVQFMNKYTITLAKKAKNEEIISNILLDELRRVLKERFSQSTVEESKVEQSTESVEDGTSE